jgi:hypothetical protein
VTSRRCSCRQVIEAENTPRAIEAAVQQHQREPQHRAYWQRVQLEQEKVPPLRIRRVA